MKDAGTTIAELNLKLTATRGLPKASRQHVCEEILVLIEHLALLSRTRHKDNEIEISEKLTRFYTHLRQLCHWDQSDGHDETSHFNWATGELDDLIQIMVVESPRSCQHEFVDF